ncbi:MAG: zinc-ribbon domain-containing protein [Hominenteromicrobium sp.]
MICKNCGNAVPDHAIRCPACGASTVTTDGADYTAQYDPRDIADNRIFAVFSYIGLLILVPILGARNSYFARFHANQGLLLLLVSAAYSIVTRIITRVLDLIFGGFLAFIPNTFSAAASLIGLIFVVLMVLGIINAATGKAKELPFLGRFRLLK